MKKSLENGWLVLRFDEPLGRIHATELLGALEETGEGSVACLDLSGQVPPGSAALAVILAASNDCRRLGIELRVRFSEAAAALVSDLRLDRHAILEKTGGNP
jgi:anti-anti-sigma regulatory factor